MDNKELTEEQKDAIKRVIDVLSDIVSDKIEHTTSMINDPEKRKRIRNLANELPIFDLKYTREGYNYWLDVYNRLRRIAKVGY